MITIKQYANDKNITYEAVRKQLKRYKNELEGHITLHGRTQYLDEAAVAFLDEKRNSSPVVIINQNKDEELQALREENKRLLLVVTELQNALLTEKDAVKQLQQEKIHLLEENSSKKRFKLFGRKKI